MSGEKNGAPRGFRLRIEKAIAGEKIRLREKKLADARDDFRWQSDPELAELDAAPRLDISFPFYLLDYAEILHSALRSKRLPLAIETHDGKHIGNCSCYDIDEKNGEAQFGIMIGDRDYWSRGYGADAVNTMVNHVFQNTNLRRIYLKTLDWNRRAQRCFKNCGFTECGRLSRNGNNFLIMEIFREDWQRRNGE